MPTDKEEKEISTGQTDDEVRIANGPDQTPGVEGLAAEGAKAAGESADPPADSESDGVEIANGPEQTPGVDGLGAEGAQ